ncbi:MULTISPECIES: SDR family NAD(P)-dependent oxidoreductase [unclassified Novosphingobium]|uniref:SDR family NAD(P)-dependent oxidoreductase n=1 Tax=unclassified Novosphingobium TaxID=2644732 RepID=UPI0025E654E4|nr:MULTISPECIES: SDR family NAD(P)-dependent oxidoreductase [unclassified Novosphingobium]HQV03181.1 SDR family NAD(P)-dependent oxidoreductase [Novosphingobium sp.]
MPDRSSLAATGSAVVFGASGAIGRALVARLVESGRFGAVHAGTRGPTTDLPVGAIPFRFDLGDEASIKEAARMVEAPELVMVATGLLHDEARQIAPEKSWRAIDGSAMAEVFAANAIGPALIAKHFLPLLPRDRRAVFAVLSARVGSIGDNRLGGWHSYRASKAALNMLVRNFAIELARSHPQALAVALHPGTVDSRLSAPFQRGVAPEKLFSPDQAAGHLLDVLPALDPADSGGLFAWDGTRLPE